MSILVVKDLSYSVESNEIIISGMLISNAMIAIGLCYRQLETSFQMRRMEIEVKLSLGADVKSACKELLRECIKTSMIPSLDSAKTLGIVSLLGMMTGLILAGTSPLEAIKFQVMVTFMTLSAASIAMIIAVYMSYKSYFNERLQLKIKN